MGPVSGVVAGADEPPPALDSSGGAQGQATDIEIHAREIIKTREQLNRIYAERTGQTIEKIRADMERDFFMDPEESKAYGLIDQVLTHRNAPAAT